MSPTPRSAGNITPGHVRAFQAVTTQIYGEVTLWSCTINGTPGVAIVLVDHVGEGKLAVMPLFVAITENMEVDFEGTVGSDGGGGGGPKDPREGFEAAAPFVTTPQPRPIAPGGASETAPPIVTAIRM